MGKNFLKKFRREKRVLARIPAKVIKDFERETLGYVLITCGIPTFEGEMQVEMTYEGDKYLASFLIKNAQELMEEQLENFE